MYVKLFPKVKRLKNSKNLIKEHIKCVKSNLYPLISSQKKSFKFVHRLFDKLHVSKRDFLNAKIFNYTLKKWLKSGKTVKIANNLNKLKFKIPKRTKKNDLLRKILGKGVWLNVLNHSRTLIKTYRRIYFTSSYILKKILKCGIDVGRKHAVVKRFFKLKYKGFKPVLCNINSINLLARMLRNYKLLKSLRVVFKQSLVKAIKQRKMHHVNFRRLGKAVYRAYYLLNSQCP